MMTRIFSLILKPVFSLIFGVFGGMTLRGIESQLGRTGIAIAALTIAVASTISLDLMVSSFRTAVSSWLNHNFVPISTFLLKSIVKPEQSVYRFRTD